MITLRNSFRQTLWLFVGSLIFVSASRDNLASQAPEEWKQRFFQEAPERWRELKEFSGRLQGTCTARTSFKGGTISHFIYTYKHNDRCRLYVRDCVSSTSSALKGEVMARNQNYAFILKNRAKDGPWAITGVHRFSQGEELPEEFTPLVDFDNGSSNDMLLDAQGVPISEIMKYPFFQIVRLIPTNRNGLQLVRVEFTTTHKIDEKVDGKFIPLQGGTLFLDPQDYWCVLASELELQYANATTKVFTEQELQLPAGKFPILKGSVQKTLSRPTSGAPSPEVTDELELDLHVPESLPSDEEFTLAAFGLPEPFDVQQDRKQSRWYLWAALGGIGCLITGILFRRFVRRGT